jgi:hypothetical protein
VATRSNADPGKLTWHGEILAVQPRIRLTRSFDQASHTYLGYALRIRGDVAGESREFLVGVGKEAHAKHQFQAGDSVSGACEPVADPRLETVEFYKASAIEVERRSTQAPPSPPPWLGLAPELPIYREGGHRRLSAVTYNTSCTSCIWGCHMAVEMIIDQWNPSKKQYRTETFCYGPKFCRVYRPGPKRVVPGRKGMRFVEEDWVDEGATSHRGNDE